MSTRSSRLRRAIGGTFLLPCSQELTVFLLTPMNVARSAWLALSFMRTAWTSLGPYSRGFNSSSRVWTVQRPSRDSPASAACSSSSMPAQASAMRGDTLSSSRTLLAMFLTLSVLGFDQTIPHASLSPTLSRYDTIRRLDPSVSVDASVTPVRPWSCGRASGHRPRNANWPPQMGRRLEKETQRVLDCRYLPFFLSALSRKRKPNGRESAQRPNAIGT